MRRIHLGVAKKIKNGARKIVLDKAEEARVAAFSAFQSLGVQVPQFPVPPLLSKLVASEVQVDTVKSPNEWPLSSIRENIKESQVSSKPQHIKKGHDNLLVLELHKKREIKDANASVYSEALGNNIRDSEYDVLVKGPQHTCSPLVRPDENAIESQASPSEDLGFGDDVNGIRDPNHKYDTTQGDNGGNISNASAILTSDRGPVNVGSTPGTFDLFMHQWEAAQEFYFDIHFRKKDTSTSSVIFEIFGIAICWRDSPIYYINLSRCLASSCKLNASGDPIQNSDCLESESGLWEIAEQRWNGITKIMGKCGVRKFTWNLKSQIQVLRNPGISIQRLGRLRNQRKANDAFKFVDSTLFLPSVSVTDGIDICLVVWILWPDEESTSSPNLEKVVKKRLPPEVAAAATRDSRWRNQMRKAAHNGCCRRVSQTRALALSLWKLLISEDLVEALLKIESPLVKVLADMELCGIGVDIEACIHARSILGKKLKELEKEAFKLAGFSFSLYSTADIANVLYTQLKLPIPDACNKGKQHYSTNKHTLDMLRDQHPIVPVIKEHRTLAKLLNSTLGSVCSKSQLCFKSQKYIIRGRWLQTSTATGRLSMEEPNLQCVEHAINFTTHSLVKDGPLASQTDHHQINARDFFGPMQDNWVLVTADYSQIELRLMAHFSGDILLIELLSRPDGDVFTMLAAKWTEKLEAAVSSEEREQTKRLVYGILYGMGANTLAEQLDCNPDEAAEKIQSFKASFPRVSAWLQNAVASCRSKGYVETLMGRKRFLSKIKFGNSKEKAKAQRQAVNSICQGSAADIIKIAMINIYSVIVEGCNLPTIKAGDELCRLKGNCRILLQVHDELLLEVNPSLLKEAALVLQFCMENAASLLVPLRVKVKVGKTWGSLQPFEFKS